MFGMEDRLQGKIAELSDEIRALDRICKKQANELRDKEALIVELHKEYTAKAKRVAESSFSAGIDYVSEYCK